MISMLKQHWNGMITFESNQASNDLEKISNRKNETIIYIY